MGGVAGHGRVGYLARARGVDRAGDLGAVARPEAAAEAAQAPAREQASARARAAARAGVRVMEEQAQREAGPPHALPTAESRKFCGRARLSIPRRRLGMGWRALCA